MNCLYNFMIFALSEEKQQIVVCPWYSLSLVFPGILAQDSAAAPRTETRGR